MNKVRLNTICEIKNGYAFKSGQFKKTGIPLIRISNFDGGKVNFNESSVCVDEKYLISKKDFLVERGDILIALSGATTGKFGIYDFPYKSLLNQRVGILKSETSDKLDSRYFFFYLDILKSEILEKAGGAAQPNISTKAIGELEIPLPPLEEQKRIAAILDAADQHRQKTKELIAKYDELSQSLFLDMFGDPVTNPKGWEVQSLTECGNFKNGLNFGGSESGESIKYLGVGDFKSKYRLDDISELQYLTLTKLPSKEYIIQNGDLVFVRSNGNKKLVGRCVVVYPNDEKMTFSGFCIRYRLSNQVFTPVYLAHLFQNKSFKNKMLESGQGANIQNINQKILGQLKIPTPNKEFQLGFVKRTDFIEKQKAHAQESLKKAEDLFQSLLQKAFKGELT